MINVSWNTYLTELLQAIEGEGEMTSEWTNDTWEDLNSSRENELTLKVKTPCIC